jgi:hypothetical protein
MQEQRGICIEYEENTLGLSEAGCKSMLKGTYSKAACKSADLLGTCQVSGAAPEKTFYYFGNTQATWVSDAKADCEDSPTRSTKGKFTEQPGAEAAAKEKGLPPQSRVIASCAMTDMCEDYFYDALDMQKDTCEAVKGTYAKTPCPMTDVVGSCVQRDKVSRYSKSLAKKTTLSAIEKMCNSTDSFTWGHYYPNGGGSAVAAGGGGGGGGAAAAGTAATTGAAKGAADPSKTAPAKPKPSASGATASAKPAGSAKP